jgi:hypothetical protein
VQEKNQVFGFSVPLSHPTDKEQLQCRHYWELAEAEKV